MKVKNFGFFLTHSADMHGKCVGDVIVNVWVCTRYRKYHEGIMIALEGRSPERTIIIPEGYFS